MANNIIQNKVANNNITIIACFTGEYCGKTFNYCSEDGPNFPDNPAWDNLKTDEDWEAFINIMDETGWDCIIAIPNSELKTYFDNIMETVKDTFNFAFNHEGHLGDDTFYDYLPDAAAMLSQIADALKDTSLLNEFKELVTKYDATYPNDELLADQMGYPTLSEFELN